MKGMLLMKNIYQPHAKTILPLAKKCIRVFRKKPRPPPTGFYSRHRAQKSGRLLPPTPACLGETPVRPASEGTLLLLPPDPIRRFLLCCFDGKKRTNEQGGIHSKRESLKTNDKKKARSYCKCVIFTRGVGGALSAGDRKYQNASFLQTIIEH